MLWSAPPALGLVVLAMALSTAAVCAPPASPATPTAAPAPAPAPTPAKAAAPTWPTLSVAEEIGGFASPIAVIFVDDGALVVEQGGLIRRVRGKRVEAEPFADLRSLLSRRGGEQGLLGLALAPDYATSRRLYVAYTGEEQRNTVAELRASDDGERVLAQKPRVLLAIDDFASNHNGGHVVVGPDGHLWVGTGDGGGAGDPKKTSQNERSQLGKMLRIDVGGVGSVGSGAVTMWAKGLRNPWRYAFDDETGDLWIADVGQNAWEEINVVAGAAARRGPPLNFGWSVVEGERCFDAFSCDTSGFVAPVFVYGHDADGGCSVTGGVVSDGVFYFADYCSGVVWGARRDGSGVVRTARLLPSGRRVSSFGRDAAGRVWLVDHGGALIRLGGTGRP